MDELLAYLSNPPYGGNHYFGSTYGRNKMIEAATEITQLREQVEVMRVALEAVAWNTNLRHHPQFAEVARDALAKVKEV